MQLIGIPRPEFVKLQTRCNVDVAWRGCDIELVGIGDLPVLTRHLPGDLGAVVSCLQRTLVVLIEAHRLTGPKIPPSASVEKVPIVSPVATHANAVAVQVDRLPTIVTQREATDQLVAYVGRPSVIGIKLRKEDRLLAGSVLQETKGCMAFIVSAEGFVKRVPLEEFPVKGRGTLGVLGLNQTKATGPIAAAGVGKATRSTVVDVLASDGKRQRMSLRSIPIENRPNRGRKGVKLAGAYRVIVWDE